MSKTIEEKAKEYEEKYNSIDTAAKLVIAEQLMRIADMLEQITGKKVVRVDELLSRLKTKENKNADGE